MSLTGEGWSAYFRRLLSNGIPEMVYKIPLELVKDAGAAWNAGIASLDLKARKHNDPAYQNAKDQLLAYVGRQATPQNAFNTSPYAM